MRRTICVGLALTLWTAGAHAREDEVPEACKTMVQAIGMPHVNGDGREYAIVCHEGQLLAHSDDNKTPIWVVERLTPERFAGGSDRDKLCSFKADPDLPEGRPRAVKSDYSGKKSKRKKRSYDMGHMAPAADMKFSDAAMRQSCYLSNIAPQQGLNLNRHIWADLEALVRDWSCDRRDLYVVTGPIYDDENPDTLGANEVAVPTGFFKLAYEPRKKRAIAFILPNEPVPRSGAPVANVLNDRIVKPREIEQRAGIRLFTKLAPRDRTRLLANKSPMWGTVAGCPDEP